MELEKLQSKIEPQLSDKEGGQIILMTNFFNKKVDWVIWGVSGTP